MPYLNPGGGSTYNPEAVVSVKTISADATTNQAAVTQQPRTLAQAVEDANIAVKPLPQPVKSASDLPTDAVPGQLYMSASTPNVVYFLGTDNIWRALPAVTVT
jgi:hypothetical protein